MDNTNNMFLTEIEKRLSGVATLPEFMDNFELEFSKFKDTFNPDGNKSKQHLDDMVKLLTISEGNLEKIKDQKWFQRVWFTIAGKNKKLERINKLNLLQVQKGSLFFLQNLANQSPLFMQSVYSATKRINEIQLQNEKIKGYLFCIVDKYNERITKIENLLENHIQQNTKLNSKKIPHLVLFLSSLFFILSSIIIFFVFEINLIIMVSCSLSLLLGLFLSIKAFYLIKTINTEPNITLHSKNKNVLLENNRIRPLLKKNISQAIYNTLLLSDLNYYSIVPFLKINQDLLDIIEPLNANNKISNDEIAIIMDEVFKISPDIIQLLKSNCSNASTLYINLINSFISNIIEKFLPKSIGLDLRTNLDYNIQNDFNNQLLSIIEPYFENLTAMEDMRNLLIQDYERFRKLLTENKFLAEAKDIIKGLLIIPTFFDDKLEFTTSFYRRFNEYLGLWERFAEILTKSINPFLSSLSLSFVKDAINDMDFLFDEFTKQNISLTFLHNEIIEVLEAQRKSVEEKKNTTNKRIHNKQEE